MAVRAHRCLSVVDSPAHPHPLSAVQVAASAYRTSVKGVGAPGHTCHRGTVLCIHVAPAAVWPAPRIRSMSTAPAPRS